MRAQRVITFCGEAIPVSNDFVANKLMGIIRSQIPVATLATLRIKAKAYFPYIIYCLRNAGLPEDLKYIPIVECGFRNLVSGAGARGFWQIMPEVGRGMGMTITPTYDERDDPAKSTIVACRLLRQIYAGLSRDIGAKSWVLSAAAYNFGIGNIEKAVRKQGHSDYFRMQLNAETAAYVYKLIAIKELFEHPEIYMNGFGANVFAESAVPAGAAEADVNTLPQTANRNEPGEDFSSVTVEAPQGDQLYRTKTVLVPAIIASKEKNFSDGDGIRLKLLDDMQLSGSFAKAGNILAGKGWIIDGRVYIDLGYGTEVEVLDKLQERGISPQDFMVDDQYVLLRIEQPDI